MAISMIITTQGLQSLSTGGATEISELALGRGIYTAGPNQTALQQPIKRLPASGTSTHGVIHVSANDTSDTSYQCYELGLYDTQDTLIAVYSQSEPLLIKADVSTALITVAIAFNSHLADHITFANTNFTYPAATTELAGVSRLATLEDVHNQTAGAVIDGQILTSYVDQTINQKSSSATDQNNEQQLATSAAIYQLKTLIEANIQEIDRVKNSIPTFIRGTVNPVGDPVSFRGTKIYNNEGHEYLRVSFNRYGNSNEFSVLLVQVVYNDEDEEYESDTIQNPSDQFSISVKVPLGYTVVNTHENEGFSFYIQSESGNIVTDIPFDFYIEKKFTFDT